MSTIVTASCAALGALLGGTACPAAARALLEHRADQIVSYWDRRVGEYACWRREHATDPDPKAKGDEGALGIWLADAKARLEDGTLARERASALSELDPAFAVGEERVAGLPAEDETLAKYRGGILMSNRLVCAAFLAACYAALGWLCTPIPAAVAAASAIAVAAVMALTDAKCHIIPFELSYALVPLGLVCQAAYAYEGLTTPTASAIGALLYALVIFGSSGIVSKITGKKALGAGDKRSTPGLSLVCAAAPLPALVGAAATTLVVPVARLIMRSKGVFTTSTPFGPHLAVGCALGLIWPAAFGAWLPV